MFYAIGLPGNAPRIIAFEADEAMVDSWRQAGEVALRVDAPGDYIIAVNGLSVGPRTISEAEAWDAVRARRTSLLVACDWTQFPDVPAQTRQAWTAYRQALRDITTAPNPEAVIWPPAPTTEPSGTKA